MITALGAATCIQSLLRLLPRPPLRECEWLRSLTGPVTEEMRARWEAQSLCLMEDLPAWQPNQLQMEALLHPAEELLLLGGGGSGKTSALLLIAACQHQSSLVVVRTSFMARLLAGMFLRLWQDDCWEHLQEHNSTFIFKHKRQRERRVEITWLSGDHDLINYLRSRRNFDFIGLDDWENFSVLDYNAARMLLIPHNLGQRRRFVVTATSAAAGSWIGEIWGPWLTQTMENGVPKMVATMGETRWSIFPVNGTRRWLPVSYGPAPVTIGGVTYRPVSRTVIALPIASALPIDSVDFRRFGHVNAG